MNPELADEEKQAQVASMRQQLQQEGTWDESKHDDFALHRFLNPKGYRIPEALMAWNQWLQWRDEWHIDGILQTEVLDQNQMAKFLGLYPHGLHGVDRKGRPVLIYRLGKTKFSALLSEFPEAVRQRMHAQLYEFIMRVALPACSLAAGRRIDRITTIYDLEGITMLSASSCATLLTSTTKILGLYYPETLAHLLLVNAPGYVDSVFSASKGMLAPATQKKIRVFGKADTKAELAKIVHTEQLPTFLGGTSVEFLSGAFGPWMCLPSNTPHQQHHPPPAALANGALAPARTTQPAAAADAPLGGPSDKQAKARPAGTLQADTAAALVTAGPAGTLQADTGAALVTAAATEDCSDGAAASDVAVKVTDGGWGSRQGFGPGTVSNTEPGTVSSTGHGTVSNTGHGTVSSAGLAHPPARPQSSGGQETGSAIRPAPTAPSDADASRAFAGGWLGAGGSPCDTASVAVAPADAPLEITETNRPAAEPPASSEQAEEEDEVGPLGLDTEVFQSCIDNSHSLADLGRGAISNAEGRFLSRYLTAQWRYVAPSFRHVQSVEDDALTPEAEIVPHDPSFKEPKGTAAGDTGGGSAWAGGLGGGANTRRYASNAAAWRDPDSWAPPGGVKPSAQEMASKCCVVM